MNSISLCMIVKDEESVVARCLDSVKNVFDEIIIVDTGSSDRTKEICKKYTDKIYDYTWCDDFAAARNYAFSMATCDYLCWLDADDVLLPDDAKKIVELKSEIYKYDTYMLKYVVARNENGDSEFEFYRERIMRRCSNARFYGFVHECVSPFGRITYSNICVYHEKIKEKNPRRNVDLYLKHIKAGKVLDARNLYYFGKEFYYLRNYAECEAVLKSFLTCKAKNPADTRDALITLYRCSIALCHENDEYLYAALKETGGDAEVFTLLGDKYYRINQSKKAETFYKYALCVDEKTVPGFISKQYYYLYPLLSLVVLYYGQGEYDKALLCHKLLKTKYPDDKRVIFNDKFFTAR